MVFDVFGDFAHFKKFYTTSSPLSFDFPPRTTLTGLVGAILGLDYSRRYDLFEAKMALRILETPRKQYFGINWLNTKWRGGKPTPNKQKEWFETILNSELRQTNVWGPVLAFTGFEWVGQSPHTQSNIEVLIDPKYRIYYSCDSPHAEKLEGLLEAHHTHFPLYLGISEFLANYEYVGKFPVREKPIGEITEVRSIIPQDAFVGAYKDSMELDINTNYLVENIPFTMEEGRKVTEYKNIIYTTEDAPIRAKVKNCFEVQESSKENVVFF
ncbi:MAG: type I-B CRISPR-associated protein Cas5b [Promethearchaeota archaeon]